MSRVVMFVLNDVRQDARVLREGGSLVAAGHSVTIVGRPGHGARGGGVEREVREGVEILRVPVPGRLRGALVGAGGGREAAGSGGRAGASPLGMVIWAWAAVRRVPM